MSKYNDKNPAEIKYSNPGSGWLVCKKKGEKTKTVRSKEYIKLFLAR
jgi:hypothetical protein